MQVVQRFSRPSSGALEALKLVALAAMVADHANKYALDKAYPAMEHVGRLAFPLFALVLAANLRWNTADARRYFMRLAGWGIASQAVYVWATEDTQLNILLTLAVGVLLLLAVEALRQEVTAGRVLWLLVALAATLPCDYTVTGPLLVLVFYAWFAWPGLATGLLVIAGVAVLNRSTHFAPAALAALLVACTALWWAPRLARVTRHWFYPFYPIHLAAIRAAGTLL